MFVKGGNPSVARRVIDVPGLHHGAQPIPVAVEKDGLLVTGGISGKSPADGTISADLGEEITQLYANIRTIVTAAGFDLDDVVKVGFFVVDAETRQRLNDGWLLLFPNPASRPARHTVVQALPAGMRLQAEIIAMRAELPRVVGSWLSAATVYEAAGQRGSLPSGIKPICPGVRVRGPAFTVSCAPRDNLGLHHGIAAAPAGSVLVCHTGGHYDAGYFGDVMAVAAAARGIIGLVIDGCVRDYVDLREGPLAVFARGLSIRGTTKDPALPSVVGSRLRIGDVDIDPGDLIIGDDDGVAVVATSRIDIDLEAGRRREENESEIRSRLREGDLTLDVYGFPDLQGPVPGK